MVCHTTRPAHQVQRGIVRTIGVVRIVAIMVVGLVAVSLWVIPHAHHRQIKLNACFQDVRGLRRGALVQIAGVDVGRTTSVKAHPERKDCLAEVEMTLNTPYELKVPSDAIARVENAGLLGEEFVDIDVRQASGPPATDHAMLKAAPTSKPLDLVKGWIEAATSDESSGSKTKGGDAAKPK